MKYLFPFLLLMLFSISTIGQTISNLYPKFDFNNQISLDYSEESNSTAFSNRFISMYHNSEYLSPEILNEESSFQKASNLIGGYRDVNFYSIQKNKQKKNTYYYFALGHQYFNSISYTDETINLLFFGNKPYKGDTVSIPEFTSYNLYLEQLKFGMIHRIEGSSYKSFLRWNGALNIGQNYYSLLVSDAYFYTSEDADFIDLKAKVEYEASDTSWVDLYHPSGKGISLDIEYGIEINEKYYLGAEINNIGFLSWSSSPTIMTADSSIHYDGVSVELDENSDFSYEIPFSYDMLKEENPSSFMRLLPMQLSASAGVYFKEKKWYIGSQIRYFTIIKNKTLVSLFATYTSHQKTFMSLKLTQGGFGNWNAGVHLGLPFYEHFRIQVGTSYMNSMFNKLGHGIGWDFSLRYYL